MNFTLLFFNFFKNRRMHIFNLKSTPDRLLVRAFLLLYIYIYIYIYKLRQAIDMGFNKKQDRKEQFTSKNIVRKVQT